MNGQRIRKISIWLVTALYLLACVSPFSAEPAPTASPTQMPVGTIVIQTAAAAQTQTAIYLPTMTLTPTPTPTSTSTRTPTLTPTLIPPIVLPFLFTATPTIDLSAVPAETDSADDTNDGGNDDENEDENEHRDIYALSPDKEWACTVLEKSPKNGAIIGKGVRFSAIWTILNRGIKTWPIHSVDFSFRAGFRNEGRMRFDLPSQVISGGTITLDVTITAPEVPGAYRSIWTLKVGRTYFCQMGINFVVK